MRFVSVDELPEISDLSEGSWVAIVRVEHRLYPLHEDTCTPGTERPLVRSWVRRVRLLGLSPDDDATCLVVEKSTVKPGHYASSSRTYLIKANQPFMVVSFVEGENNRWYATAQQVHHGQLGRRPEISGGLACVPSSIADPLDGRRTMNWANLSDVARLIGFSPEDVLRTFAFCSSSTGNYLNVPVLTTTDIHEATHQDIHRIYIGDMPEGDFCPGGFGWDYVNPVSLGDYPLSHGQTHWIPQAFAHAAVRLAQFGYGRDGSMPDTGCLLEAPAPTPPHTLPTPKR